MKLHRHDDDYHYGRTTSPFGGWWRQRRAKASAFDFREHWWRFQDRWEHQRSFRLVLLSASGLIVLLIAAGLLLYPWWTQRNAIRITRKWIDADRLDYAAESINRALAGNPARPEFWRLAAEIARLNRQPVQAVENARRAAALAPGNSEYTLVWASEALQADQLPVAQRALATLPADTLAGSAAAQRMLGEIARRRHQPAEAAKYFEAALQLDGPVAIDEVPLGLVLLSSDAKPDHARGQSLLLRWTTDREWGPAALRGLLGYARQTGDAAATAKWAQALLQHSAVTVADLPLCLGALAEADPTAYAKVLAALKQAHAISPAAATQLLGWLNQIGRTADAQDFIRTLPPEGMRRPPLVAAAAEILRQSHDWAALLDWTGKGSWGNDVDFLRWVYRWEAARQTGDAATANELWQTLRSHTQLLGGHGLFAASTLYAWGRVPEAVALYWLVADQSNDSAIQALGSLARHYQVQRDAEGQYRAFRRLHTLHPQDAAIGNNYAFFAALTGNEIRSAAQAAGTNLQADPQNLDYLATAAFVSLMANRAGDTLAQLQPKAGIGAKSPGFAFVYGLALAKTGNRAAARPLLQQLPPESLTLQEVELIRASLSD